MICKYTSRICFAPLEAGFSFALVRRKRMPSFITLRKVSCKGSNWGKVYGELAIMYDGRLPD